MKLLGPEDRRVLLLPGIYEVVRDATLGALDRGPRSVIADADIYLSEWGFEVSQINFPIRFWHGSRTATSPGRTPSRFPSSSRRRKPNWSEIDGHYSLPITHSEQIIAAAMQKEAPELLSRQ